jgi:hypothetical protein
MHLGTEATLRHRAIGVKLLDEWGMCEVAGDDNLFLIPSIFVLE